MAPGMFSSYSKMGCQGGDNLPKSKEKSQEQGAGAAGGSQHICSSRKGRAGREKWHGKQSHQPLE